MKGYRLRSYARFCNFLLAGCLWAGTSSCKKDREVPAEIFGDWQWVSDVGGITGKDVKTPATTKYERTYRFNRDSTFVECTNNKCEVPVKFKLRMEKSIFDGQQHLIVTIPRRFYLAPPDTGFHILIFKYKILEMQKNLRLAQESPDGYEELYNRK